MKPPGSGPRDGARPAARIGLDRGIARLFYAVCLAVFLWGAWERVAVQNVYQRETIQTIMDKPVPSVWERFARPFHATYYPPLHDWIVLTAALIVGDDPTRVTRALWVVPIVCSMLIALYYRALGRPRTGWFAAGIYLLLPCAWNAAVFPSRDATPAVFVAAAFLFQEIAWRRRSGVCDVAAGVALGSGMLAKWTFSLFAAPWAILQATAAGANPRGAGLWRRVSKLARVSIAFLAVTVPWYGHLRWNGLLSTVGNDPGPRIWGANRLFFGCVVRNLLAADGDPRPLLAILGLLAILAIDRRKNDPEARGPAFLAAAVVLPMTGALFLPHLESRYLAPLAVAVLLAPAFARSRAARAAMTLFLLAMFVSATWFNVVPELRRVRAIRADPAHGAAEWYDPAAAQAEAWFASVAPKDPDLRRGILIHPMYQTGGLRVEGTLPVILFRVARIPVDPWGQTYYAELVERLRNRQIISYILTNCGDREDCVARNRAAYDEAIHSNPGGYMQPGSGERNKPVAAEPLGADWPYLVRDFDLCASATISKDTWYLWKRKLAPPEIGRGGS